jgi:hypothetical protein
VSKHILSVRGTSTCLDGQPFLVVGLRCSNALISDRATGELIANLGLFASYGVNAVSVYWMGSRFGYMLASTWLQAVPPLGPDHRPGGDGTTADPGIRWWLEFLRDTYGPYPPGATGTEATP